MVCMNSQKGNRIILSLTAINLEEATQALELLQSKIDELYESNDIDTADNMVEITIVKKDYPFIEE